MPREIFTVGHSNHTLLHFLQLLTRNGVTALADVRSKPYSRRNPQFSRERLSEALRAAGIAYVFLGDALGGKQGKSYDEVATTELFRSGLARLREGAEKYRVAFMCAEREPLDCHRTMLVSRHLKAPDLIIRHILADGSVEEHVSVERRLVQKMKTAPLPLMESDPAAWEMALRRAYDARGEKITNNPASTLSPSPVLGSLHAARSRSSRA
jgi:uncharacterized protein (DUF488 family)